MESPTNLPCSADCALEVFRRLVHHNAIKATDVTGDPSDLALVADAAVRAKGNQTLLVRELRASFDFHDAAPNDGHRTAIALMLEDSVSQILTTNFDLAVAHAKTDLRAEGISIIESAADFPDAGALRVIFAHGNADCDAEHWVLQSADLEKAWKDTWAEALAKSAFANPFVVFIGMGSSAPLISHCASFIKACVPTQSLYQVDPEKYGGTAFTSEVGVTEPHYMECGFTEFMRKAGNLLLSEQLHEIENEVQELISQDASKKDDISAIRELLERRGLTYFGELRAAWLLNDRPYLPHQKAEVNILAETFLGLARIATVTAGTIEGYINPYILLTTAEHSVFALHPICGRGTKPIESAQTLAYEMAKAFQRNATNTIPVYLAVGYPGQAVPLEPQMDERSAEDILSPDVPYRFVELTELRQSQSPDILLGAAC